MQTPGVLPTIQRPLTAAWAAPTIKRREMTEISCIMSKLIIVVIGIFTKLMYMGISLSDVGCVLTWEEGYGLI